MQWYETEYWQLPAVELVKLSQQVSTAVQGLSIPQVQY